LNWSEIELKWQRRWYEEGIFEADLDPKRPKFFIIFAYPGISGYLHVGHMRSYTYPDVIARYKRMRGYNVLFPAGFHASGLPAISFAKRVERGAKEWIEYLIRNGCPEEEIPKLKDPKYVVKFFSKIYIEDYWKRFGFTIDFRRTLSTISPEYNRFIEWQFKKLMERGLLVQKPHYAPYCPNCGPVAVDPSETDVSKGGTASILEFTILKFKWKDYVVPAATLRPETIFGVTNVWVDPNLEYSVVSYKDEKWIVSKECVEKLKLQKEDVSETGEKINGRELIGKVCEAPITGKRVIILPAEFIDPNIGTGIVMSVPAHAPYDWMALKDLKKNWKIVEEYGLKREELDKIEPISIIETEGFSDFPSEDMEKELSISTQKDKELLEKATEFVYKKEFHSGKMKENCGEYAGLSVSEAKEKVKERVISEGSGDTMYEFSEEVICRCGERVLIRRIPDQWFIRYSDKELKEASYECIGKMTIRPREYKENLPKVIDWYEDRACVRQGNWLGTRFPFDKEWIIEPISDSTLYPAFYIVSLYVNKGKIKPEQLKEEFFDYVFLGKGDVKEVSKKTGIEEEIIESVRKDFLYWYPLDMNCGGKEHQTVHFPVFVMNHVAILNKEHWPKGIFVNWWVVGKGGKISKSKGGAEPIPNAVEIYSVDGMRLYYCHAASPHVDVVWDGEVVSKYRRRVDMIFSFIKELKNIDGEEKRDIDMWLLSRANRIIKNVTAYMEDYNLREAANEIYFNFYNDLKWYLYRGGKNRKVIEDVLKDWIKLMVPFTPHLAEEAWEFMGNKGFVSIESWPKPNEDMIREDIEYAEDYLKELIDDIKEIVQLKRIKKVNKVYLYTAEDWKWKALSILNSVGNELKEAMKKAFSDPELKKYGKALSNFMKRLSKEIIFARKVVRIDEEEILRREKNFLEKEIGAEIIVNSDYDPENRRGRALPLKPAVYIE